MTKAVLLFALVQIGVPLYGTTIDFESQGANAPSVFNGRVTSPLVIGLATFSGGEVLRTVSGGADTTAVYATTNLVTGPYANPLTITLATPVSAFSVTLTNELPDTYTVMSDAQIVQSLFVNANTNQTFSLAGNAIGSISISSSQTVEWDFAIDSVTFTPASVVAPEPALFGSASCGLLAIWIIVALERRRGSLRFVDDQALPSVVRLYQSV